MKPGGSSTNEGDKPTRSIFFHAIIPFFTPGASCPGAFFQKFGRGKKKINPTTPAQGPSNPTCTRTGTTLPAGAGRRPPPAPPQVHCCWNGMAALNAAPFTVHGLRFRAGVEVEGDVSGGGRGGCSLMLWCTTLNCGILAPAVGGVCLADHGEQPAEFVGSVTHHPCALPAACLSLLAAVRRVGVLAGV